MKSENQKSTGGLANLANLANSTLEAAKKEPVSQKVYRPPTPTPDKVANLAKTEKPPSKAKNNGSVDKKVLSDMDWLRAIVDSITDSTIVTATVIAWMVAEAGIPWPGGMAEPEPPQMAVGKIMARLFNSLVETRDEVSGWMVAEIRIDAKRRVRRCKEKCCNKKQEWYTKIRYCIDDEDKPSPF